MAIRYYDEAITNIIKTWVNNPNVSVLKPDEVTRLFQKRADETNDKPLSLPLIGVSRDTTVQIDTNVKTPLSFNGYPLIKNEKVTLTLDAIPILLNYQIDIFTKSYEEGDEYLRSFVFKIINNPTLVIDIPYNNKTLQSNNIVLRHIAYMRLLPALTDNSDISEKLFADQFTRWTLQIEIQDAFLFSVPVSQNWSIDASELDIITTKSDGKTVLQEEKEPIAVKPTK
jgi:hypothetical protein